MSDDSQTVPPTVVIAVTVVVPIKNEASNLSACLSKLTHFADVVVVDSQSTDGSIDIAEKHGARVLQFNWNGSFPKKRNWCLRTYPFITEWVLFLDADEQVTPAFLAELSAVTRDPRYVSYGGFWIQYQNYFLGRLLKYGDTLKKLSLLRLGKGEFERIEEKDWCTLDMEVHEHLIVDGLVGTFKAPIIHRDFKDLTAYYGRHNQYSSWEASRYIASVSADRQLWTWRQKIKYRMLRNGMFPILYFLYSYIIKAGFLDGREGFRFCLSKMFYYYQVYFKIDEKCETLDRASPAVKNTTTPTLEK